MVANLHLNLQNGVNKALAMLETSMSGLGRYPLSTLPPNPGFHLVSLEANDNQTQQVQYRCSRGLLRGPGKGAHAGFNIINRHC